MVSHKTLFAIAVITAGIAIMSYLLYQYNYNEAKEAMSLVGGMP